MYTQKTKNKKTKNNNKKQKKPKQNKRKKTGKNMIGVGDAEIGFKLDAWEAVVVAVVQIGDQRCGKCER